MFCFGVVYKKPPDCPLIEVILLSFMLSRLSEAVMGPFLLQMGRTFGRLASTVENQLSAAYKRGERRRDRALAMLESAQQAAGRLHESSNVALPLHV